ncbi:hypothetical protein ACUV84_040645 [Puccinellia chinampoensis]
MREGRAAARGPGGVARAASANPGLDHERHGREGGGATDDRLRPGHELPLRLFLRAAGRRLLLLLYAAGRRLAAVVLTGFNQCSSSSICPNLRELADDA